MKTPVKWLLITIFLGLMLSSCTEVKEVKTVSNAFYKARQDNNNIQIFRAILGTSRDPNVGTPKFWTVKLKKLDTLYGKIISYKIVETNILTPPNEIDNRIAIVTYKVKYEKATVKERLILKRFGINDSFKIYAFESGIDQKQ